MPEFQPHIPKFRASPGRLSIIEATLLLLLARLVMRLGGLTQACRVLRLQPGALPASPTIPTEVDAARRVAASMARARNIVGQAGDCLPQCLAAAAMLRRRGVSPTLHFAVAKSQSDAAHLYAHAWLAVGEEDVTGGGDSSGLIELQRPAS